MFLIIFHVVSYDVWFYATHRLSHTTYLWRFHKIHHEKIHPTFLDTNHGHWSEFFQSVGILLPLVWYDMHWMSFILACMFTLTRGHMRHDSRTAWLIGNHHMLHHELKSINYGEYYLDYLFGTVDTSHHKRINGYIRL